MTLPLEYKLLTLNISTWLNSLYLSWIYILNVCKVLRDKTQPLYLYPCFLSNKSKHEAQVGDS